MKKLMAILLVIIVFIFTANREGMSDGRFAVYTDRRSPDNHYCISGYTGDYNNLSVNDACTNNPHSGETCIKVTYFTQKSTGKGWTSVFWQHPPNNWKWGENVPGFNLTGYKKLTFWARGEKGGEILSEVGVGCIRNHFSDSDSITIGPLELSKHWEKYTIDLNDADLSDISGGFHWSCNADKAATADVTFYLDDIVFKK